MNIYAIKDHIVECETFTAGYDYQKEIAIKYLEIGKEYTIEKTDVYSWYTDIWLQEFPNINFNSVFFKDKIEQSEEMNKQHKDYYRFNKI